MLGPSGSLRGTGQAPGGSPRQLLRGALLLANGAFGLWEVDVARTELRLVGARFVICGQECLPMPACANEHHAQDTRDTLVKNLAYAVLDMLDRVGSS